MIKTALFVAEGYRLGSRKIAASKNATRETMAAHLKAAFIDEAANKLGCSIEIQLKETEKENEPEGKYSVVLPRLDNPNNLDYGTGDSIIVRKASIFELRKFVTDLISNIHRQQ